MENPLHARTVAGPEYLLPPGRRLRCVPHSVSGCGVIPLPGGLSGEKKVFDD